MVLVTVSVRHPERSSAAMCDLIGSVEVGKGRYRRESPRRRGETLRSFPLGGVDCDEQRACGRVEYNDAHRAEFEPGARPLCQGSSMSGRVRTAILC